MKNVSPVGIKASDFAEMLLLEQNEWARVHRFAVNHRRCPHADALCFPGKEPEDNMRVQINAHLSRSSHLMVVRKDEIIKAHLMEAELQTD